MPIITIVTRKGWKAEPSTSEELITNPVDVVVLTTTRTNSCRGAVSCKKAVKELQRHYMEDKGLPDIPYNFLVTGHGKVFEGRGWKAKPTQLDKDHFDLEPSIDIAFLGNYIYPVPEDLKRTAYNLITVGVRKNAIDRLHFVDICLLCEKEWFVHPQH